MTREIPVGRWLVTQVDDQDYERLAAFKWHAVGKGYACRGYRSNRVWMHREILGAPEGVAVDHINRDRLDNRRENLRICTAAENTLNRSSKGGADGYKGVIQAGPSFHARIYRGGKERSRGPFRSSIEAAVAYDLLATEVHGEFARLNFDPSRDWLFPFAEPLEIRPNIPRDEAA